MCRSSTSDTPQRSTTTSWSGRSSSTGAAVGLAVALALGACDGTTAEAPVEPGGELGYTFAPLWVNGNFENGTHNAAPLNWTVNTYSNPGIANLNPQQFSDLGLTSGGAARTKLWLAAEGSQADGYLGANASIRWPRYGGGVAVLDVQTGAVANTLEQTMSLTVDDIDPVDGKLHIRFALAPVLENPNHAASGQPYFYVELRNLTRNIVLYRDFNYANQPGVPWKNNGNSASYLYTDWQLVDIAPTSVQAQLGDNVRLLVVASGCSPTGHWARVYIDGVGPTVPSLFVSATGPASANAGDVITYDMYYNNGGNAAAGGSTVKLTIPTNTTFHSVTGADCTAPAVGQTGLVTCNVGTVNPGQSGSFQISVRINAGASGTITNGNYTIQSVTLPPLLGPKVFTNITVNAIYADLSVTKTDNRGGVAWGSPTSYTIVVRNDGPSGANSVPVVDTLPAQLTGATWTCVGAGGGTCAAASGSGNINTTVNLPVNATATFTLNANIVAGNGNGTVSNTVTVAAPAGVTDSYPSNNGAVDTNFIGELRTVTVTKVGIGQGTLVSVPSAINCGSTCVGASATFVSGQQVVLSVNPLPGHTFEGWGGDCAFAGTSNCSITVTSNLNITATISKPKVPNGTDCTLNAECQSNICVDGVCCNSACGGGAQDCQACNLSGRVGTCSYLNLQGINDGAICDAVDNDCDGQTDEDFVRAATSCGVGSCARTGQLQCNNGVVSDTCSAGQPSAEVCDGADNDCDGLTDANDNSMTLIACDKQQGVCVGAMRTPAQCVNGVWQSCPNSVYAAHAFPYYSTVDLCDGRNNDCDAAIDEDHVVEATSCGSGACARTGQRICSNGNVLNTCAAGQPAANDTSCNGVDDNCNGLTDEGYVTPNTSCGTGACARSGQAFCIAGAVVNSCVAGTPAASDTSCNGVDDNCNGQTDEGYVAAQTSCGVGECRRTGSLTCSNGAVTDSCSPGAPSAEICDGKDNDCDGLTDAADPDMVLPNCEKQGGVCAGLKKAPSMCVAGAWQACGDAFYAASRANYATTDACDAIDNDCDGVTDENFTSQATSCGVGECRRTGSTSCSNGNVVDSCAAAGPSNETCDGKDNDCDGLTDGADDSLVLVACEKQQGVCAGLMKSAALCVGGAWQACNDAYYTAQRFPDYATTDSCDGRDNDCDGQIDENFVAQQTSCGVGECRRTGSTTCNAGVVGNNCTAGAPSNEICDGKDNDCDGQTDGADSSLVVVACEKQAGVCAGVQKNGSLCVNGAWQACTDAFYASARFGSYSLSDTCDGLDNDCDNAVDENHVVTATSCGTGACSRSGQRVCQAGTVVDTCAPGAPAASDASCNNVDDDCDGQTDEHYLPTVTTCGTGGCLRSGLAYCVLGQLQDSCNASEPSGTDRSCNGLDEDCDGLTDEEFPTNQICVVGRGACERTGAFICSNGGVVCDTTPGVPSPEICDGVDNDCDGLTDEGGTGSICQRKETAILTQPPAVTAARTATFTFNDPLDPSATAFQCSLDGGPWVRCDGGAVSFAGLSDGSHTFLVRSVGADGSVDTTPAFYAWTIDQTRPDTFFIIAPADPSQSTTANFAFGATVSEISGYRCALDPMTAPPAPAAYAPCQQAVRYQDLAEGPHSLWVYVISAAGVADPTPAVHRWTIDLSAPETEITGGPAAVTAQSSATFTYRSPGEPTIRTFRCRFDGGAWQPCDGGSATFDGLTDGEYTFEVVAVDSGGIVDPTPATWRWEVDSTPPDTFITVRPDDPSQVAWATFAFASDERDVTYRCALDIAAPAPGGAGWMPCDQVLNLTQLAAGDHVLHVAAVDQVGAWDPTPATWTWTVDLSAPETVIDARPPVQTGPNDGATFAYSSPDDGVYFECRVDTGAWQRCDSGSLSLGANNLNVGDHTFQVRACTNVSGLCDPTPAVASWTVTTSNCPLDAQAPNVVCPAGGTWECNGGGRAFVELGPLEATDPCGVQDVSDVIPVTFGLGTTPVVRAVQDGNKNRASCVTEVTVVDTVPPTITCGEALTVAADPGLCGAAVVLPSPLASDTCHRDIVVFNNAPQLFPVGTTPVTWTALDPSGHTATCVVNVTVEDREGGTIDCVSERVVDAPAEVCGWSGPVTGTARDNCAVEVATLTQDRRFPIGNNDVIFTATDNAGNEAECTTKLLVRDVTPPTVACPVAAEDTLGVFTPSGSDACEATLRIGEIVCEALDAAGQVTSVVDSASCPVSLDESGALVVSGRLADPALRVRFAVLGEDPSGNIGRAECALVFSPDRDGDEVMNGDDNCPGVANPGQEDGDGDGTGDACDVCPTLADDQTDSDGNGIGDACQDLDRDGTLDAVDNCPDIANPDQSDVDGDGIGDLCDPEPWEQLTAGGSGTSGCGGGGVGLGGGLALGALALLRRRRGMRWVLGR